MTTIDHQLLPSLHTDPFGDTVLEDPRAFHRELLTAGTLVRLPDLDVYATGRYEQVHAALTDWQHFESGAGVGLSHFRREAPWRPPSLLLETDPPQHDAPRSVLSQVLTPSALRGLKEPWSSAAEELVDGLLTQPVVELDGVPALAEAYPLRVFPDAVGLQEDGREHLLPYGDHLFNAFGPSNALVKKGEPTLAEHAGWVNAQCEREALTPGGFGAAVWDAADRGEILHEQAARIVRSLLSAGVDTTVHGLAALLYAVATHPEQWQRLRDEPGLLRSAFDEAVRWQSPVQTFFRTATTDVQVGDGVVPQGEKVLLFLGAANRDPRRWDDPDRFDVTRDPSGHVGFGMGLHQCVGQHVARLEAEALMTALLERVERIELLDGARRHHNNTLRAWASLPLRLHLA